MHHLSAPARDVSMKRESGNRLVWKFMNGPGRRCPILALETGPRIHSKLASWEREINVTAVEIISKIGSTSLAPLCQPSSSSYYQLTLSVTGSRQLPDSLFRVRRGILHLSSMSWLEKRFIDTLNILCLHPHDRAKGNIDEWICLGSRVSNLFPPILSLPIAILLPPPPHTFLLLFFISQSGKVLGEEKTSRRQINIIYPLLFFIIMNFYPLFVLFGDGYLSCSTCSERAKHVFSEYIA